MTAHEDKIRELLDVSQNKRLNTAMKAGETAQTLAQLQQQLASTEAEYNRAYRAAVEAGWSDKELKQIGLAKPTGRARKNTTTEPPTPREPGTP